MAARNMKKVAVSVLALGAATSAIVFGSFAAWTAQTTNPGNQVSTASFSLTNSRNGSPVFTVNPTNLKPGDNPAAQTVTITNASSIPMAIKLTKTAGTDAASDSDNAMKVQINDDTANACVLPANASPCGANYATWTTALSAVAVPGSPYAAGTAHVFSVRYNFESLGGTPTAGPSTAQTATFGLTWDGTPS